MRQALDEIGEDEQKSVEIAVQGQFLDHVGNAFRTADEGNAGIEQAVEVGLETAAESGKRGPPTLSPGAQPVHVLDRLMVRAILIMFENALGIGVAVALNEIDQRVRLHVAAAVLGRRPP